MNKKSARNAREFGKVLQQDRNNHARSVIVPGHNGKSYRVILRRPGGHHITTECQVNQGIGYADCKGNVFAKRTVCYHSIAAVDIAAGEQGFSTSWCESKQAAENLANLGGIVVKVSSHQGKGHCWTVIK